MRSFATLLSALVLALAAGAAEPEGLGLAERRAIKAYQDAVFPPLEERIVAAAGEGVTLEIDWASLAIPGRAEQFGEEWFWTQIYFEPLAAALEQIGRDEMGREALAAGLSTIHVHHDPETAPQSEHARGVTFEDGRLTINWRPATDPGGPDTFAFRERVEAIVDLVEARL